MNNDGQGIIFLLIIFIGISFWLFTKFKKEKKQRTILANENQRLLVENALFEADHLKFQMQPHTLNNILAKLKVIAKKLNKGMDSLSETLDYILYKGHKHFVSIEDEINFIKKYLALNDLFLSQIDSIDFNYSQINENSEHFKSQCIPHLITAYFIENAFKHGDLNHPEFLKIELKLNNTSFEMFVINRFSKKSTEKKGGLGLQNMKKRLDLLVANKYEIKTSCNEQEYFSTLIIHL